MADTPEYDRLPLKRKKFVDAYIGAANGCASAAAKLAGYSQKSAVQIGHSLKRELHAAITERLKELTLGPEEVLAELALIARGSLDLVLNDHGHLDLEKARANGGIRLIQEIAETEHGMRIKLYSRLDALEKLGKHYRLFTDKVEHSGPNGGPLQISEVVVERPAPNNEQPGSAEPLAD